MVQGRLGEAGPRQLAVGELHAVKAAPLQIGVREIAVAENHVRKLRTGKHAPREETAREEASLHRKVLAVERCEVRSAERSVRPRGKRRRQPLRRGASGPDRQRFRVRAAAAGGRFP